MKHKARIIDAFEHRTPDRTPCFEYCLFSNEITGMVLKRPSATLNMAECVEEKDWEEAVRQLALDQLDLAEFFDYDMMYVCPNSLPPEKSEEAQQTPVPDQMSDDPVEAVAESNRRARENGFDWDERRFLVYETINDEMEKRGCRLPVMAPAYKHGVWTNVDLMQTMVLEPDVAQEHFAIATQGAMSLVDKYVDLGVEIIGIGGDFAGNTPLISPACYRSFIAPELKKLSDRIHAAGFYAVNASDGNLWSAIDAFLIESGVDGYLEIDLHAGMELGKLKAAYGGRITFLGNMDCGNTLSFSSPDDIAKETVRCIEDGLGNGGHILTASNAITDSVPVENYFALVNAYRDYWKLPRLSL